MGEAPWLGTIIETPGLLAAVSATLSTLMICMRIVGGIALFTHGLPGRRRFAARCAGISATVAILFVAFLGAATAVGAVSPALGYLLQFGAFTLILAACVGAVLLLFDASVWVALFCVTAGYTAQNLATGATELVASVARALGANPSAPAFYLTNDLVCLTLVFLATYLLLARRITHEGLVQMENHSMLAMMPVVSLVIIGFDIVIKALTGEGLGLAYVVALRLFHGIACVATLWIEYQLLYRVRVERDQATAARLMAERERQLALSRESIDAINIKCHDLRHQIRSLADGGAALGFMAPADLYALFGNALDNAIEAVSELGDPARRSISLVVRRAMGGVSIHVENYYAGERRFSADGMPETTKADRSSHGFGTRSMRQIAERYDGSFSAEAAGGVFRLDVILPAA